jgi:lactoylglutathione lyase
MPKRLGGGDHPLGQVEGLVLRKRGGSSSLPGRTREALRRRDTLRLLARLAYSILFVADLERSVRFYRDTIGLPFRFATESYAEFATEGAKFGLYARPHLPELIGRSVPTEAVPWPQGEVAFFIDDPDAEHERLRRAGVHVLAPPTDRPWGERTLHLADPDGNVIELTRPKERR